jgi:hypothetical protein
MSVKVKSKGPNRTKSKPRKKTAAKKNEHESIINFLMQIVHGDVMPGENGEMSCPTIGQRITASQILLRVKNDNGESKDMCGIMGIDIPQRSTRYDEWLSRVEGKISADKD